MAGAQGVSDTYRGESDVLGEIGEVDESPKAEAPQAEAAPASQAAAPQAVASQSLPFTGSEAILFGAGGALLLVGGLGLRRLAQ